MDNEEAVALAVKGTLLAALALLPAYLAYRRVERLRATGIKVRGAVVCITFRFGRPSGYHSTIRFVTQVGQVVQAY